jgi:SagB-type dehydrogenase family enzyme
MMLSWRDGTSAELDRAGTLRVSGPETRVALRGLSPALVRLLLRLEPPGTEEDALASAAAVAGLLAEWYYRLQGVAGRGLVVWSAWADGTRLATLVPISRLFEVPFPPHRGGAEVVVLSRFAYLRRVGRTAALESPLSHARVLLNDPRSAALIAALVIPRTREAAASAASALPGEAGAVLLRLLDGAGMLQAFASDGTEAEPASLRTWEFHDLLFHTRSREGRTDALHGGTCRVLPEAPSLEEHGAASQIPLPRPDLACRERDDPPLALVLRQRRSMREFGPRPIAINQLAELLYRVARVTDRRELELTTPRGPVHVVSAARPYPSGGALYELEFYAAVHSCDGLQRGLYGYNGEAHALHRLATRAPDLEDLLVGAARSAAIDSESLQVLIILTARFARIAWKYESIAYSLILKHVGVVYQTMYLVATSLGLAACALGCGDSDAFSRAAGTDYYRETSVGEFLLGSRGPGGP